MKEKKLIIFLSYAREQKDIARKIFGALAELGHTVFFDEESLPTGDEYRLKIINEIETSELMIFLISPDSVQKGTFARSELRIAKSKAVKIFPVMVVETDYSLIPDNIDAKTIFTPHGDTAIEVINEIYSSVLKQNTKTITDNIKDLQKAQRLKEIDDEWEEKSRSYKIIVNGRETNYTPSPAAIVVPLAAAIVMAILILFITADMEGGGFFAFLVAVFGAAGAVFGYTNLKKFEKEQQDYYARRAAVEGGETHNQNDILNL